MFGVNKKGEDILGPQFRPGSYKIRENDPKPGTPLDVAIFIKIEKQRLLMYQRRLLIQKVLKAEASSGAFPIPSEPLRMKAREMIVKSKQLQLVQMENERLDLISRSQQTLGTTIDLSAMSAMDRFMIEQDFNQIDTSYHSRHPEVIQEALMLAYEQGEYSKEEKYIEDQIRALAQIMAEQAAAIDASARGARASASAILSIKS